MNTMPRQFINLALALMVAVGSFGATAMPALADGTDEDKSGENRGRGGEDGDNRGRRGAEGEERRGESDRDGHRLAVNGEVTAVTCESSFTLRTRDGREVELTIVPGLTRFRYPGGESAECGAMPVGTTVHVLAFRGPEINAALIVQLPKVKERFAHKVGVITELSGSTIELNDEFQADMSQSPAVRPSGYAPSVGDRVLLLVKGSGDALPVVLLVVGLSEDSTPPAGASATLSSEVDLTETNLDGRTLALTLTNGAAFADDSLAAGNFTLNGAPAGASISGVTWDSSTQATLTLAYTGDDFDSDASLSVTVDDDELAGDGDLTTNTLTVTAVVEPATATISADPALNEIGLSGRIVNLTLSQTEFVDNTLSSANFTLNGAPVGTTVGSVIRVSATQAMVILAYDSVDFDTNASMSLTVAGAELTGGQSVTSNTLTVIANVES